MVRYSCAWCGVETSNLKDVRGLYAPALQFLIATNHRGQGAALGVLLERLRVGSATAHIHKSRCSSALDTARRGTTRVRGIG